MHVSRHDGRSRARSVGSRAANPPCHSRNGVSRIPSGFFSSRSGEFRPNVNARRSPTAYFPLEMAAARVVLPPWLVGNRSSSRAILRAEAPLLSPSDRANSAQRRGDYRVLRLNGSSVGSVAKAGRMWRAHGSSHRLARLKNSLDLNGPTELAIAPDAAQQSRSGSSTLIARHRRVCSGGGRA